MASATGVYHTTYRKDFALRHTRAEWIRLALIVITAVALPFVLQDNTFWMTALVRFLIFGIAVVGLMVLTGYTGLVSLATGAFLGVGAYATANVASRYGWPMPVGVLVGTLIAALIGALFGLPALRLKGLYLAITTLAAQYILTNVFRNWDYLTDGAGNIAARAPCIGGSGTGKLCTGTKLDSDFAWYWIALVCLVIVVMAVRNLFRTGLGRAFIAIRDQDIAAEVIGVNVGRYKVLAFAIACGLAGFSGALNAHWRQVVTYERYEIGESFLAVAMIIIGGLGSVAGAVYGAGFMIFLESFIERAGQDYRTMFEDLGLNVSAVKLFAFGAVIVLFLLLEPRGLARLWQRAKDYFRLWPFRY